MERKSLRTQSRHVLDIYQDATKKRQSGKSVKALIGKFSQPESTGDVDSQREKKPSRALSLERQIGHNTPIEKTSGTFDRRKVSEREKKPSRALSLERQIGHNPRIEKTSDTFGRIKVSEREKKPSQALPLKRQIGHNPHIEKPSDTFDRRKVSEQEKKPSRALLLERQLSQNTPIEKTSDTFDRRKVSEQEKEPSRALLLERQLSQNTPIEKPSFTFDRKRVSEWEKKPSRALSSERQIGHDTPIEKPSDTSDRWEVPGVKQAESIVARAKSNISTALQKQTSPQKEIPTWRRTKSMNELNHIPTVSNFHSRNKSDRETTRTETELDTVPVSKVDHQILNTKSTSIQGDDNISVTSLNDSVTSYGTNSRDVGKSLTHSRSRSYRRRERCSNDNGRRSYSVGKTPRDISPWLSNRSRSATTNFPFEDPAALEDLKHMISPRGNSKENTDAVAKEEGPSQTFQEINNTNESPSKKLEYSASLTGDLKKETDSFPKGDDPTPTSSEHTSDTKDNSSEESLFAVRPQSSFAGDSNVRASDMPPTQLTLQNISGSSSLKQTAQNTTGFSNAVSGNNTVAPSPTGAPTNSGAKDSQGIISPMPFTKQYHPVTASPTIRRFHDSVRKTSSERHSDAKAEAAPSAQPIDISKYLIPPLSPVSSQEIQLQANSVAPNHQPDLPPQRSVLQEGNPLHISTSLEQSSGSLTPPTFNQEIKSPQLAVLHPANEHSRSSDVDQNTQLPSVLNQSRPAASMNRGNQPTPSTVLTEEYPSPLSPILKPGSQLQKAVSLNSDNNGPVKNQQNPPVSNIGTRLGVPQTSPKLPGTNRQPIDTRNCQLDIRDDASDSVFLPNSPKEAGCLTHPCSKETGNEDENINDKLKSVSFSDISAAEHSEERKVSGKAESIRSNRSVKSDIEERLESVEDTLSKQMDESNKSFKMLFQMLSKDGSPDRTSNPRHFQGILYHKIFRFMSKNLERPWTEFMGSLFGAFPEWFVRWKEGDIKRENGTQEECVYTCLVLWWDLHGDLPDEALIEELKETCLQINMALKNGIDDILRVTEDTKEKYLSYLDDSKLSSLALEIGPNEWKILGTFLGHTYTQLQHLETNHHKNIGGAIQQMLIDWRNRHGADVNQLVTGLIRSNRKDLLRFLKPIRY